MPRNSGVPEPQRGRSQTIAFGLVNVPVKVKSLKASRKQSKVTANYVCPDHNEKVSQKRYCEVGDHYPDAVKMFPTENGYVQLDEDLLDQIVAEKTGELRIDSFVDVAEIDPIYLGGTSYLIYPDQGGQSTYDLLAAALREAGFAGVGNAVFGASKSTQMIVLRWSPATETMVAHTVMYDSEIQWSDVDLVANAIKARPAPPAAQVKVAEQVIDGMTGVFDPTAVADSYTEELRNLIEQAAGGAKITAPSATAPPPVPAGDVMDQLLASINKAKKKKTAAKKATA